LEDVDGLRRNLVFYLKKKFYSRHNIVDIGLNWQKKFILEKNMV
jgi:hypothetical protein